MDLLPILQEPNARLRRISEPVTVFDQALIDLAGAMQKTRAHYRAHGLAAPQIGRAIRLVSLNPGTTIGFRFMVNPEIIQHGSNKSVSQEGCLSIEYGRRFFGVKRWDTITVRFQTLDGETKEVLARGLGARAVQHEIDHLEGRLIGGAS